MKFQFRNKTKVKPQYGLTPLGKIKAEEFHIAGAKGEVIGTLEEIGSGTIGEIAEASKMTPERVKLILQSLISNGYVGKINTDE